MNQITSAVPQPAEGEFGDQPRRPRRPTNWSLTAIAGFVLSLIGFLGITAILGFIFGIFGLIATGNNRLRGRNLAVAALPISLVMGALSVFLLFLVQAAIIVNGAMGSLRVSMGQAGEDTSVAIASFREVCSQDFNEAVSDDQLGAWFKEIRAQYGTLTGVELSPRQSADPAAGGGALLCAGKFVNGTAVIRLVPRFERPWRCRLDDIDVNGSSPR